MNKHEDIMTHNRSTNGFTLMEVIIAIGVILVGVVGAIVLVNATLTSIRASQSRVVAAGLAQEGLELVRSMRDDNWHTETTWDDAVLGCGSDRTYIIQRYPTIDRDCAANTINDSATRLYRDSSNRYTHEASGNTATIYRRMVTAKTPDPQAVGVEVLVQWEEQGQTKQLLVEDRLWNWR